jgi:hypothetical protein
MLPTADLNDGARALAAFLRPYPMKTCGTPLLLTFDYDTKEKRFRLLFKNDSHLALNADHATEIFLPKTHYGAPFRPDDTSAAGNQLAFDVSVSDGSWEYDDQSQVLRYFHGNLVGLGNIKVNGIDGPGCGVHEIIVSVISQRERRRRVTTQMSLKKNLTDGKKPARKFNICNIL